MQQQREIRCGLTLIVFIAIVGSSFPCFSKEPAYADEFFAVVHSPSLDMAAPLFAMNDVSEEVEDGLFVLADAAASEAPEPQYQSGIGTPRGYPGRRSFETPNGAFFKAMGVGMFVAAAGDFATTELGLQTPGLVEVNPVQRNLGVRIATHVAVPAFVYWLTERARKNGSGKLALLIRIGANVAFSYAAMHNARTLVLHR